MCISLAGQISYVTVMSLCVLFTLVSMFTPAWRNYTDNLGQAGSTQNGRSGIFTCRDKDISYCFKNHMAWENVVTALILIGLFAELVAVCWGIASFFACCFRKHFLHPLPGIAAIAAICLLLVIIIFAAKYRDEVDPRYLTADLRSNLDYSFYLMIVAFLFAVGGTVAGGLTVFFADRDF